MLAEKGLYMNKNDLTEEIRDLIAKKNENANLDYKETFNWDKSNASEKCEIVKDILAMANTKDGGSILFGVKDDDLSFCGINDDAFKSFDPTKVNDFLHKYTDPKHTCSVYKTEVDGLKVALVRIPEFEAVPIICKKNADDQNNTQVLKSGGIYIRTAKGSSELVPSSEEMRELINRAALKRGDDLLSDIERLLKDKPISSKVDDKYSDEITDAEKYITDSIGDKIKGIGSWEITISPKGYNPERIPSPNKLKELVDEARVSLRGWSFPHEDKDNQSNFNNGRQSFTIWDKYIEAFRAYESGLVYFRKAFWEDVEIWDNKPDYPVMDFLGLIWTITEYMIFAKRYYEAVAPEGELSINLKMHGTKDRLLVSLGRGHMGPFYKSMENPIIIKKQISVTDLRVNYKEISRDIIIEVFSMFNWNDPLESMIDDWQMKLIERKF
jgi:hypothetical protein